MIEIIIDKEFLYLNYKGDKSDFHKYINILLSVPNRLWCTDKKHWKFKKESFLNLKQAFRDYPITVVDTCDTIGSDMKLKPYPYQEEAIRFALTNKECLLVYPCGSGKTALMIGTYLEARKRDLIEGKGVIIVKASLKTQWKKEISKFCDCSSIVVQTYAEATSKFRARIKKIQKENPPTKPNLQAKKRIMEIEEEADKVFYSQFEEADIFILNYETLKDERVRKAITKSKADFCACDEIQMLKNHKSDRSKATYEIANNFKMRVGATATPITKDPSDVFGIFKFVKPSLFSSFTNFGRMYIKYGGFGKIIGFRNMDNLRDKIGPHLLVKTKDDINDQLPSLVVSQKYCDMTPAQAKMNDKIMQELEEAKEKEFKARNMCKTQAEVDSSEDLAKLEARILALQTFAQELSCSPELLKMSDSEMANSYYVKSDNPKLELCAELVEQIIESGEKVCIFSKFERMQDILTERIKKIDKSIKIAYVNGSIDHKQRAIEVYDKFQEDEEYKVLLMSDAGAEGLNLSSIKYLIEIDIAQSYALQTQRHGRLERADSIHDTVFVYQLISNESWDEIAMKIVDKKEGFDLDIIKSLVKK